MNNFKKGITEGFIVTLVLVCATGIILFLWLAATGKILNSTVDTEICRSTLLTQQSTSGYKYTPATFTSPVSANCPSRHVTIGERSVTTQQYMRTYFTKTFTKELTKKTPMTIYPQANGQPVIAYSQITEEVVLSTAAESMRRCWYMGLEGEEPIFNSRTTWDRARVCMVCDNINLEGTKTFGTTKTLSTFLNERTLASKGSQTYSDYLFTVREHRLLSEDNQDAGTAIAGLRTCLGEANITEDVVFEPGSYVTVLFRDFSRLRPNGCIATYVIPAQQTRDLCDFVLN